MRFFSFSSNVPKRKREAGESETIKTIPRDDCDTLKVFQAYLRSNHLRKMSASMASLCLGLKRNSDTSSGEWSKGSQSPSSPRHQETSVTCHSCCFKGTLPAITLYKSSLLCDGGHPGLWSGLRGTYSTIGLRNLAYLCLLYID